MTSEEQCDQMARSKSCPSLSWNLPKRGRFLPKWKKLFYFLEVFASKCLLKSSGTLALTVKKAYSNLLSKPKPCFITVNTFGFKQCGRRLVKSIQIKSGFIFCPMLCFTEVILILFLSELAPIKLKIKDSPDKQIVGGGIEPKTSWSRANSANHWNTTTAQNEHFSLHYWHNMTDTIISDLHYGQMIGS